VIAALLIFNDGGGAKVNVVLDPFHLCDLGESTLSIAGAQMST
jgi:hypothetical protein